MSGPFKRRPSLKSLPNVGLRKDSLRRPSATGLKPVSISQQEVPWDVVDRCLLPVLFCHAAAIVISAVVNALHISQVSTLTLFIFFAITTIAAVLFFHNLKVSRVFSYFFVYNWIKTGASIWVNVIIRVFRPKIIDITYVMYRLRIKNLALLTGGFFNYKMSRGNFWQKTTLMIYFLRISSTLIYF